MVGSAFIIPSVHSGFMDLVGSWTVHWGSLWMMTRWCVSFSSSTQSFSTHSTDTVWTVEPGLSLHRNTHKSAWPLWMPKVGRQVQSLDTEALPKFGREEKVSSLSGVLALQSCITQTPAAHGHELSSLGCGWVMLFLLAPAGLADTADDARGSQKQQGRSHQGDDAQPHENPNHLCSVPHHWGSWVAKLIPTRPSVIVSEENVIVQVLKAVPAKRVFAVFTHHLSTAFVALDINPAHWALLNRGVCLRPKEGSMLCWQDAGLTVPAGDFCMPSILAARAELQVAGRALHQHGLSWVTCCDGAHRLTVCHGTPRSAGVQVDFSFKF